MDGILIVALVDPTVLGFDELSGEFWFGFEMVLQSLDRDGLIVLFMIVVS
ncbi:MAG: hypothetical protein H7834_14475 [Magnetococcus sp. YQC-9]